MIAETHPMLLAQFTVSVELISKLFKFIDRRLRTFPGTYQVFHANFRGQLHLLFKTTRFIIIMARNQGQAVVARKFFEFGIAHPPKHTFVAAVTFQLGITHFT